MNFDTQLLENSEIQLIDGDRGKNYPKQADFNEEGHCLFLSAKNVTLKGFEFSETSFIDAEKDEVLRAGKLQRGDIVVTTRGTIGNISFYGDDIPYDHIRINSGMMIFRPDKNRWNNRFLYFLLTSKYIRRQIESLTSGSAVPQLPARDLKKFELPNIPRNIQDSIEKIVGDITDKIEVNRQTNKTLEEMAQAVFKSWFVDFEPTRAKIKATQNGQDPTRAAMAAIAGKTVDQLDTLSPEQIETLTATADLFPDALVDSDLGEIPVGWKVTDLKSTTSELRRGISPKYCDEDGVSVINQKCIRNHSVNFKPARLHDPIQRKISGRQLELGDVLVNSTGVGTLGRLAPVRVLAELTIFDSHVTVVRADVTKISAAFLACLMFEKEAFIEASGAGSTGQTELRKQVLEDIQFATPSKNIAKSFDAIVVPMGQKISILEQEQESLAGIRDTLLPKLLSGEIDVSRPEGAAQ